MSPRRMLRTHWVLTSAYLLIMTCGVLVFAAAPSTSLSQQGGYLIVVVWALLCLLGGLLGTVGLLFRRVPMELFGAGLGASASLTWGAALVLQAVRMASTVPLTAACLAVALTALLVQRWVDAWRSRR
jgi:hypothetical protein